MKFIKLSVFFTLCLCLVPSQAQDNKRTTIINDLESSEGGSNSTIRVIADPGVNALIGVPVGSNSSWTETEFMKISGFRVQAYSGNDPRTSKDEAARKERLIKEAFPEIKTYVNYRPPRWSLRVGDFRTREEAVLFMQELKSAFPEFGREMYTVKEEVNIPVYK